MRKHSLLLALVLPVTMWFGQTAAHAQDATSRDPLIAELIESLTAISSTIDERIKRLGPVPARVDALVQRATEARAVAISKLTAGEMQAGKKAFRVAAISFQRLSLALIELETPVDENAVGFAALVAEGIDKLEARLTILRAVPAIENLRELDGIAAALADARSRLERGSFKAAYTSLGKARDAMLDLEDAHL